MPRRVANELAQGAVDHFNDRKRKTHPRINKITGLVDDQTGMFVLEVIKKRQVRIPA